MIDTLSEAFSEGSPVTSLFILRNGNIYDIQNGDLLASLGIYWPSEIVGKSIHDVLAPHFTGDMTAEKHKKMFDEHMKRPKAKKLGIERTKPFKMKSLDGRHFDVYVTLSEPRVIGVSSIPGLPATERIEGVTAWVLSREGTGS